jgi:outer membrane lipoprotein-sorting protein
MKQFTKNLFIFAAIFSLAIISFGQEKNSDDCSIFLNVEFLKTGEVGDVSLLSSTCDKNGGLENKAIEQAKKIEFTPKKKNGKFVSIIKKVRYDFKITDDEVSENIVDIRDKISDSQTVEKAEEVIAKAIKKLGGEKYLNVKTLVGEGRLSLLKDNTIASFQSFSDIIVYPDNKERTDFNEKGSKTVQVNTGETGWIYEEFLEKFGDQGESQIENFKQSMRTHYDYLLRGKWKDEAELSYVGRRPSTLGKRNDVLKLTFEGGFVVEYEFDDEGLPMKTLYLRMNADNQAITEENRYARFLTYQGILMPSIVDHFTNGIHTFRVAYENIEFNKNIPDEIFVKPDNPKKLKKKLKL